jgi:hypothetical protein
LSFPITFFSFFSPRYSQVFWEVTSNLVGDRTENLESILECPWNPARKIKAIGPPLFSFSPAVVLAIPFFFPIPGSGGGREISAGFLFTLRKPLLRTSAERVRVQAGNVVELKRLV